LNKPPKFKIVHFMHHIDAHPESAHKITRGFPSLGWSFAWQLESTGMRRGVQRK